MDVDAVLRKVLVYSKALVAAVAAGFLTWSLGRDGFSEEEVQAVIAAWIGVAGVYLARNRT